MSKLKERLKKIKILVYIVKFLRELVFLCIEQLKDRIQKKGKDADIRIAYYGWGMTELNDDWLFRFIQSYFDKKVVISWYKPHLIICSVFGNFHIIQHYLKSNKIKTLFSSGENLHGPLLPVLPQIFALLKKLNTETSFSLGFDPTSSLIKNHDRFPLWLMYIFPANFAAKPEIERIRQYLETYEHNYHLPKPRFASLVARHDGFSGSFSRIDIVQEMNKITPVSCGGKLLHNDDSLQKEFKDNKKEYLKQFVFNICPENSKTIGYTTEKIFEAIEAGCIPVYWGDLTIDQEIISLDRVIQLDEESSNEEVYQRVAELYHNDETRKEFLSQALFQPQAADIILDYFTQLGRIVEALLGERRL